MTLEYRQSLTELNTILNFMDVHYIKRIPRKFVDFISLNMDRSYIPNISRDIPIDEQALKKHTKVLMSILYRNYWCDNKTKEILKLKDIISERKRRSEMNDMYSADIVFNKREDETTKVEKIEESAQENTQLIKVEKTKWYQKIFKKILSILKKHNK